MSNLILVHESDQPLDDKFVTSWAGAVETHTEACLAFPDSNDGELYRAMQHWRSLPEEEQKQWERELMIDASIDPDKSRFPLKGIIPIHMYMLLDHFYPNFLKDEDFLDEFFTTVGKGWSNPRWKPKPPNERRSRGPSSYLRNVMRILEDGSLVPILKTLRYGDRPVGSSYLPGVADTNPNLPVVVVSGR